MKIRNFIFSLITLAATSAIGAPTGAPVSGGGAARTAPSQVAPARNAPGGPVPGIPGGLNNPGQTQNPNQNGQQPGISPNAGLSNSATNSFGQPGSPQTGAQNFVTNSVTGQNTNQSGTFAQPGMTNRPGFPANNFTQPPR
jgi:hypothetical protein